MIPIPPAVAKGLGVYLGAGLLVGAPLAAWHGYKRTGSTAWAAAWAGAGLVGYPIALPVALAQGFAAPGPCSSDPQHATARIGEGCDCVEPYRHVDPSDVTSPCVNVATSGAAAQAALAAQWIACRAAFGPGSRLDPTSGECVPAAQVPPESTAAPRALAAAAVLVAALAGAALHRRTKR